MKITENLSKIMTIQQNHMKIHETNKCPLKIIGKPLESSNDPLKSMKVNNKSIRINENRCKIRESPTETIKQLFKLARIHRTCVKINGMHCKSKKSNSIHGKPVDMIEDRMKIRKNLLICSINNNPSEINENSIGSSENV